MINKISRIHGTALVVLLALLTAFALPVRVFADGKPRVAVFDPATTSNAIDSDTRVAVRELICSALVNSGSYTILERAMLDKVMKESKFTNSAAVDETQATELGKLAGAAKVVLPVLSKVGGKIMLSVKLINVTTASVELQKATVTDPDHLLADVEPLTAAMLGQESIPQTNTPNKGSIAFVNLESIVQSMPETASAQNQLQAKSNTYELEFKQLQDEIQKKYDAFNNTTDDNYRNSLVQQIQDLNQRADKFRDMAFKDLQQLQHELMAPIFQKVEKAVKTVAQENSYTILPSEKIYTGTENSNAIDATSLVKAKLGLK